MVIIVKYQLLTTYACTLIHICVNDVHLITTKGLIVCNRNHIISLLLGSTCAEKLNHDPNFIIKLVFLGNFWQAQKTNFFPMELYLVIGQGYGKLSTLSCTFSWKVLTLFKNSWSFSWSKYWHILQMSTSLINIWFSFLYFDFWHVLKHPPFSLVLFKIVCFCSIFNVATLYGWTNFAPNMIHSTIHMDQFCPWKLCYLEIFWHFQLTSFFFIFFIGGKSTLSKFSTIVVVCNPPSMLLMNFITRFAHGSVEMLSFFMLDNEAPCDKLEDKFIECVDSSNWLSSFALQE